MILSEQYLTAQNTIYNYNVPHNLLFTSNLTLTQRITTSFLNPAGFHPAFVDFLTPSAALIRST
jgi:hypothetical protein